MYKSIIMFFNLFKLYKFSFYIKNFEILDFDNNNCFNRLDDSFIDIKIFKKKIYTPIILQIFIIQLLTLLILFLQILIFIITKGKDKSNDDFSNHSFLIISKNNETYKYLKSNDPEIVKIATEILFNKSCKILC